MVYDAKTPCIKCGYDKKWSIDWHHVDPTKKSFDISRGTKEHGFAKIAKELEKCICLCSNCHREFHYFYGAEATPEDLEDFLKTD